MGGRGGGGGGGARPFSASAAPATLRKMSSRSAAEQYLSQASGQQLRDLARSLDIRPEGNKATLIARITQGTVGFRLNSAAMRRR